MVRQKLAQGLPNYKLIRPWENAQVDRANAAHVLAEAEQALRNCPA